jgi:hypothetical protein
MASYYLLSILFCLLPQFHRTTLTFTQNAKVVTSTKSNIDRVQPSAPSAIASHLVHTSSRVWKVEENDVFNGCPSLHTQRLTIAFPVSPSRQQLHSSGTAQERDLLHDITAFQRVFPTVHLLTLHPQLSQWREIKIATATAHTIETSHKTCVLVTPVPFARTALSLRGGQHNTQVGRFPHVRQGAFFGPLFAKNAPLN